MQNWKKIQVKTVSESNLSNPKTVQLLKSKKQKFNFYLWLKNRIKEFCSVTALHGYAHIIREDTALWERVVWALTALGALIAAIILLWFSWSWNAETPTVTVIESTHYATWNIPFPAITICSSNKISNQAALAIARAMKRPGNLTAEELSLKFRLILHFEGIGSATEEDYMELHNILQDNKINIESLLQQISPNCMTMLTRCMWKGTQTRCDTLFQVIKTVEGYCCSFNYYGMLKNSYSP